MAMVSVSIPVPREVEKGITIGTGLAWGAGLGAIQRKSPVTTTVLSFIGAIGGLIGAMVVPDKVSPLAAVFEGMAAGSAAIFGMGLTAPKVAVTAAKIAAAKGPNQALLRAGQAAQQAMSTMSVKVGAGLE